MGAWKDFKEGAKVAAKKGVGVLMDSTSTAAAKEPAPPKKPFANLGGTERAIKDRGAELKKVDSYKKGGKVKKTGLAKLHKGEHVLTTKQTKKLNTKPAVKKALGVKKAAPIKKAARKSVK